MSAILRRLVALAKLQGPAVVLYLRPPYYPAASPGHGPLVQAARVTLAQEGLQLAEWYPLITDASYLRSSPADTAITRWMPANLGGLPPLHEAADLNLDVVSLGPWGRDAHGVFERVHAPYAFERLPRLVIGTVRAALRT